MSTFFYSNISIAQIQVLSESELDKFTAGQSNLNHKQGRGRSEMVVVNDSIIQHNQQANTILEGVVQSNLRAINLSNISQGDSISGVNVINDVAAINNPSRDFFQLNQFSQSDRRQGKLGFSEVYGVNIKEHWGDSYSSSASSHSIYQVDHINTRTYESTIFSKSNANVPKFNPLDDFTINLGTYDLFDEFNIGKISLDARVLGTGLKASVGPVKIIGPVVNLGQLHFLGDDLYVRNMSARLPGVNFGTASVQACVTYVCTPDPDINIGTLGGQTISLPDIPLPGLNPFQDFDLNLGSGIAMAGKGYVEVGDLNTSLTATFGLDLGDNAVINGFANVAAEVIGLFANVDPNDKFRLPVLEIEVEVPISSTPGFTATFDGTICLGIVTGCEADQEYSRFQEEHIVKNQTINYEHSSNMTDSYSEYYDESILVGARLSGAEADLIAMSNGTINTEVVSNVSLKDGAQSNMRVINAMNTAYTLSGNAINISRNSAAINSQRGSGLTLQQGNVFKQYR